MSLIIGLRRLSPPDRTSLAATWLSGWLLLLSLPACQPAPPSAPARRLALPAQSHREHVEEAFAYLENLDQFREQQATAQTVYHLNRWLEAQQLDSDWRPDAMVDRLPRIVREQNVVAELPRRLFNVNDVHSLQQSVWMRQLSNWVSRQPLPPLFAQWLERSATRLGDHEAEQLATAYRLFDWTVRNIQLDALMPYPEESASAPAASAPAANTAAPTEATTGSLPPSLRAIPGPGYHFEPWQVLVYGHGDSWQRMRVFTLLARQQGIDVVTLAFPGVSIPPRPRPWVSGVLIKDQLFLFDARLGLPIPGQNLDGVATLREVLDDPALLAALDLDEQHPYRVDGKDLAEVAAVMDVDVPVLSQRFAQLESQLVGEHRTVLTVPLSELANRLKACPGVFDVYVWTVPFEATWYRLAYEAYLRGNERATAEHLVEYGIFLNHSPLVRARYLYFRGQLDSDTDRTGAKELLMESRVNKDQLEQLQTNEETQRQFGLRRTGREQEAAWQAHIATATHMILSTKQCASYWLGLFQLESGRADSAIEWFTARSLEPWPDGLWAPAARYNLARAYEAQGNWGKAQELLLADESLQAHGNYVRARILQKHVARLNVLDAPSNPPSDTSQ